jgi:hypothetical protein
MKTIVKLAIFYLLACACNEKQTTYSVFEHIEVGKVRAEGWLRQMVELEKDGVTGHLDEIDNRVGGHIFFTHNVVLDDQFGWWDGEYESNWMDGFTRLACSTDDSALINKAGKWFEQLMEVQKNDKEPYIGIYSSESVKYPRWSDVTGELWPQCRVFLAMLTWYERTKDEQILLSLRKAADLTIDRLQKKLTEITGRIDSHSLMMVEPMVKLYQNTKDKRYLDFAVLLYDKIRWFNDKTLSGQLFLHGVHVAQNVRIPLILYEYTGNNSYLNEGLKGMELCINRYMNVAGTLKSDEMVGYAVPDRGSEYCTTVEWFISNIESARIVGDMHFADVAERCYFNAAQGAQLPNCKAIQYSSFPNQLYAIEQGNDEWKNQPLFSPAHQPLCCNAMAGRILPYYLNYMWTKSKNDGFLALLYGPSTFRSQLKGENNLVIREVTNYPFDDKIQFKIELDNTESFPLQFRIPSWCDSAVFKINNEVIKPEINTGIAKLERTWKNGDVIDLFLPMKARPEFLREWVSVVRGPLVYALPVPYEQIEVAKITPGFSSYKFLPKKDFPWNQVLMFNLSPKDSMFIVHQSALEDRVSPWANPPISITTKAQVSNDKWRLGMQWYTRENLQPPAPPSVILAYQIDKSLSKEIKLVPYGSTRLRIVYFPFAAQEVQ